MTTKAIVDLIVLVGGGGLLLLLAICLYAGVRWLMRPLDEHGCRPNVYKVPK